MWALGIKPVCSGKASRKEEDHNRRLALNKDWKEGDKGAS